MAQGFTLIDVNKPKATYRPRMPKEWWTPKDVMKRYAVSASTVSRWKKMGAPFVGPAGTQRVEPEKMERWFKRQ
ncbi:DNA-binding protein [Lacticaseibacillus paracasei subsp. tolerans]|uniref:DNA-binding protein n=1 Tax=Lacticaseibacillus paracasei TaxID=1597 RepID=UPI0018AD3A1B|nr:DNA-binding protein [Lacticaseibacillus paracasei]QPI89308.1 DNA-binding protein [Lacticaseibacillus paracasei subsp. tolerans]